MLSELVPIANIKPTERLRRPDQPKADQRYRVVSREATAQPRRLREREPGQGRVDRYA